MEPNTRELYGSTAQIYQDCLYAYGKVFYPDVRNELWRFDLSNGYFYSTSSHQNREAYLEIM